MRTFQGVAAVAAIILLGGCAPSPADLMPTAVQVSATPTIRPSPMATMPMPEFTDVRGLARMVEAWDFDGWGGWWDVTHIHYNEARVVMGIVPSSSITQTQSADLYYEFITSIAKYMVRVLPDRELRLMLVGVYQAEGPTGSVQYYQLEWTITFPAQLLGQIAFGQPKAITQQPDAGWFWNIVMPQAQAQIIQSPVDSGILVRWRGIGVEPTPLPTSTPRSTKTPMAATGEEG